VERYASTPIRLPAYHFGKLLRGLGDFGSGWSRGSEIPHNNLENLGLVPAMGRFVRRYRNQIAPGWNHSVDTRHRLPRVCLTNHLCKSAFKVIYYFALGQPRPNLLDLKRHQFALRTNGLRQTLN